MPTLLALLLACLLLLPASAEAQQVCETNCVVRVGSPFVAFTEEEPTATGYRVLVNGVARTNAIASLANGFIEFLFPNGLPTAGNVSMVIEIIMPSGATIATDPNVLSVVRRKVKIRGSRE